MLGVRQTGHYARDCWNRKGQSSTSANLVEEENLEDEEELEVAFTEFQESLNTPSSWYMDSGASHHVTGEKAHLESSTSLVARKIVTTAGGEKYTVGASRNLKVQTQNGEIKNDECSVRTVSKEKPCVSWFLGRSGSRSNVHEQELHYP